MKKTENKVLYNREYYEKNRLKIIINNTKHYQKKKKGILKKRKEMDENENYVFERQLNDYYEDNFIMNAF